MSSSRIRVALLALALTVPVALAGCSGLQPVYGGLNASVERVELAYARPANRLQQIIIQSLKLRLGESARPDAPVLFLSTSTSTRALTSTRVTKPFTQREVTVTASYRITYADDVITSGTRTASASYGTSGQVLADEAALKDASERAAVAVAETIRLSLLAELSNPARFAARAP